MYLLTMQRSHFKYIWLAHTDFPGSYTHFIFMINLLLFR
ncbi:hypothetical protein HmCmsJML077_02454 [Escherichia coli]|nr:hypothetical protein HmCmsJML077_02454 [Escherichia coli]